MGLKQAYFALRDQIRFAWAQYQYSYEPQGQVEHFNWDNMRHIVVLKLDGKLGDTQVMTHFYRNLKNLAHKPTLTVVCPENLASVYYDVLGFDQVLVSSRKPKAQEIKNLCQQIIAASQGAGNNGKIDLVLSTEPNYRPRDFIFNYLLKPDFIVGCDPKVKSINLFLYHPTTYNHPVSQAFCNLMEKGNLAYSTPVSYTPLFTKDSLSQALAYLRPKASMSSSAIAPEGLVPSQGAGSALVAGSTQSAGPSQGLGQSQDTGSDLGPVAKSSRFDDGFFVFGLNPLGAPKARRMSVATSVALANAVLQSASNTKVLLMCQSSFSDYIKSVMSNIDPALLYDEQGEARVLPMPDNTSVLDLGALIHCIDALITVDTATVHLACASKIPELCFYNNDNAESCRWAPIGQRAQCVKFADANFGAMDSEPFVVVANNFIKEQIELNKL